jgi:hypothetical protein
MTRQKVAQSSFGVTEFGLPGTTILPIVADVVGSVWSQEGMR